MSASSAATPADSVQQNFNPSWMRSAFHGGGVTSSARISTNDDESEYPLSAPVFVKNRYGREDLLALVGQPDSNPPDGLTECPLYVPVAQQPIVCYPLSELEQRLQQNVNSSKAMSQLTHAERANVASGVAYAAGVPNPPANPTRGVPGAAGGLGAGGGWTPVKSSTWTRGAGSNPSSAPAAVPPARGGPTRTYVPATGRGGTRPNDAPTPSEDAGSPYGQRYVARGGRGTSTPARGGSATANLFNSRAQGLYDPRDPKDRPRNRGEEGDTNGENGGAVPSPGYGSTTAVNKPWTSSSAAAAAANQQTTWNKESWNISRENSHNSSGPYKSESASTMPEWMDDDDMEPTKPASEIVNTAVAATPGTFDDKGRFRQENNTFGSNGVPAPTAVQQNSWTPRNPPVANGDQSRLFQNERMLSQHSQHDVLFANQRTALGMGYPDAPPQIVTAAPKPRIPAPNEPTFMYMDPNKLERGPFSKDQMDAWFKSGYFNDDLTVKRSASAEYRTLGELKRANGANTPFDYVEDQPAPSQPVSSIFPSAFGVGNMFGGSVWNSSGLESMNPMYASQPLYDPIVAERKRIDEQRQMQLVEEQLRREQEMLKTVQRQAEEQSRQIQERERMLKQKEEEITRRMEDERMKREMEQMQLAERVRTLEAEKQARLDAEEYRRQSIEREHRRKEAELQMAKEAEDAKRRAELDRMRKSEEAAEEHRRKLQQKADDDAAKIRQIDDAKRKAAEKEAAKVARAAANTFEIEEAWGAPEKPQKPIHTIPSTKASASISDENDGWTTATSKKEKPAAPKVAPWLGAANGPREKTLKEIQEEEERQLAAERKEQNRARKEQEAALAAANVVQQSSGTWSSQRGLSWTQPSVTARPTSAGKLAWGGASLEQQKSVSPSPFWDGPSLQAANRTAPVAAPKKAPAKQVAKPAPPKPAEARVNPFMKWVVSRLKEINPKVDAEVLVGFLNDIDNPNDVEDYFESYLGNSKITKEFVKEYLSKRSEMRARSSTQKDDLSSASVAGNGAGSSGNQGKKKKGKESRVVDGSLLGFRPAGDPNRLNQGEIETVPLSTPGRR